VGAHVVTKGHNVPPEVREAGQPVLVEHADVAEADLVGGVHGGVGPHARVQRRVDGHRHLRREADPLPARHRHELLEGHAGGFHHAHRLVGADDRGAGAGGDALRAPQVVEVRVADHDPVGLVDVVRREARARCAGNAIDVGVEEDDEPGQRQPEGGAPVPVQAGSHAGTVPLGRRLS
jgi:hypothetical protein